MVIVPSKDIRRIITVMELGFKITRVLSYVKLLWFIANCKDFICQRYGMECEEFELYLLVSASNESKTCLETEAKGL